MTTLVIFLLLSLTHLGAMVVGYYLIDGYMAEKKPTKRHNKYHY